VSTFSHARPSSVNTSQGIFRSRILVATAIASSAVR